MNQYLLALILAISTFSAFGEVGSGQGKPRTKEQIDQLEAGTNALEALKNLKSSFESKMRARGNNCRKAFGHEQFCECLNSKLVVGLSFLDYVLVITNTKDDIGYKDMPEEQRGVVDSAYRVRDLCVSKMHSKQ